MRVEKIYEIGSNICCFEQFYVTMQTSGELSKLERFQSLIFAAHANGKLEDIIVLRYCEVLHLYKVQISQLKLD